MEKELLDLLDDDETHPIPHLGKIDVAIYIKNGGYYGVVVERPLVDDAMTRERILRKFDAYLNDFYSEEFEGLHGSPLPGKLRIYFNLHPATANGILDFLQDCRPWLADSKVELVIRFLGPEGAEPKLDAAR
jgi:hypothetical protein